MKISSGHLRLGINLTLFIVGLTKIFECTGAASINSKSVRISKLKNLNFELGTETEDGDGKGQLSHHHPHRRIVRQVDVDDKDHRARCPREMFFHERGNRCVPILCYGGNIWRDNDTGDCALGIYNEQWNDKLFKLYPLRKPYWDYYEQRSKPDN